MEILGWAMVAGATGVSAFVGAKTEDIVKVVENVMRSAIGSTDRLVVPQASTAKSIEPGNSTLD